jgi:succinyl-CoA synthetase beta subunit
MTKYILLVLLAYFIINALAECELKAEANYYADFGMGGQAMDRILQAVNSLPGPNHLKNLLINIYGIIAAENTKHAEDLHYCLSKTPDSEN